MALRLTSAAARATAAAGRCMSSLAAAEAYPAHVLNVPATEVTTLSNGVRVASEGGHGETATVGVYIDAGSRYETPANNGVAHFLEHMNFKGTNSRTKTDLEVQVENMGGHLNAYTSREQTVYYAKVLKQDVGAAVDLLADMLTGSKYEEKAIETERGVILRELEEVNKMPEEVIFDRLHETAFQGSSLGYTILGSPENIGSITRADLADYVATHYTGPRIVVAGAGALEHGALVELADKAFGALPSTPAPSTSAALPPAPFVGSDIRMRDDSLATAHVALAFETGGWLDGHSFPLMVLQQMLGQWDRADGSGPNVSAALCRDLAAGPYVHSTSAFNTSYKDTGLFGVYFTADPTDVFTATAITMHNLARLATDSTDVEVERAKQQLATAMTMSLDGTTAVCEDIGRQMLTYGRRMTPAEVYARIAAVDIGAVHSAAMAVIHDQDLAAAGIGNVHEMPDYNYLRRRTYFTTT